MAHISDMSAALQAALLKEAPARCSVEMILDPGGLNLDLSLYVARDVPLRLNKRKSIQPYGNVGAYSIAEISVEMKNDGDVFNHNRKGALFYYAFSRLTVDKGASDAYIRIPPGAADRFDDPSISTLIVNLGETSYTFTISTIVPGTNYDQINFTDSGSIAFADGAVVETPYLPGRRVSLKTIVSGETEKIDQFVGILKGHPALTPGRARITLFDPLKEILDVELKANDYRTIDGSTGAAASTLEYKRANSDPESTGLLDMSQVIISINKCKIGSWSIRFTSNGGAYQITDPDGEVYSGSTGAAGSFPATNTQIAIPVAAWSGSFDLGDEISFQTVCSFGSPINGYDSVPSMIEALLLETFAANLPLAALDSSAFTDLKTDYDEMVGSITYTRPTSVLKAIEILQQHISATLFSLANGLISIAVYRPRYQAPTLAELSPSAEIMELSQDDLGRLERVLVQYAYSHTERKYTREMRLPDGATFSGKELTIRAPAYHNAAQARAVGERVLHMWRKGVKAYQIKEKWNHGLGLEVNELVKISSLHPALASRPVEIYDVRRDINAQRVDLLAFDLNYSLEGFLTYDIEQYDTGKAYW